jgi:hypothetical protein
MLFIILLSVLLTFYKINNKPFIYYLQASINYLLSSKLYVWKQRLVKHTDKNKEEVAPEKVSVVPMVSQSKLKDLSWSLDIKKDDN